MAITAMGLRPYRLALKQPWQSHQGRLEYRRGWLVLVRDQGITGYGDCAPLPEAGTESLRQAWRWLARQRLRGLDALEALWQLPPAPECPPAARCGLETALLDLCARQAGKPLARWLDPAAEQEVRVNASIGGLDPGTPARLDQAIAEGYRLVKVKVGIGDAGWELRSLATLVRRLPANAALRLDANRAWSPAIAQRVIAEVWDWPVESIEEPLATPELGAWAALQRPGRPALAVDESLAAFSLAEWAERAQARRVIIKPTRCGGLLPALALARQARKLGMECLVTSSIESAVGVWAATHLAAALSGGAAMSHGLATSAWLVRDVAPPPAISGGAIRIGSAAGLGLQIADRD